MLFEPDLVPRTRFLMEKTFQSRCMEENTKIIEEIVELRKQQADILGYKNHATYIQEIRMAKNPDTVSEFLTTLGVKLQPLWKAEKEVLLKLKKEETEELGREFNEKLDDWDFR